jgi:hypothetical protein
MYGLLVQLKNVNYAMWFNLRKHLRPSLSTQFFSSKQSKIANKSDTLQQNQALEMGVIMWRYEV